MISSETFRSFLQAHKQEKPLIPKGLFNPKTLEYISVDEPSRSLTEGDPQSKTLAKGAILEQDRPNTSSASSGRLFLNGSINEWTVGKKSISQQSQRYTRDTIPLQPHHRTLKSSQGSRRGCRLDPTCYSGAGKSINPSSYASTSAVDSPGPKYYLPSEDSAFRAYSRSRWNTKGARFPPPGNTIRKALPLYYFYIVPLERARSPGPMYFPLDAHGVPSKKDAINIGRSYREHNNSIFLASQSGTHSVYETPGSFEKLSHRINPSIVRFGPINSSFGDSVITTRRPTNPYRVSYAK